MSVFSEKMQPKYSNSLMAGVPVPEKKYGQVLQRSAITENIFLHLAQKQVAEGIHF